MTLHDSFTRASNALQMITNLTTEKQALMTQYWRVPQHERMHLRDRLQQIDIDLANAQEERRRAQAGAPPAPLHYNPLGPLHHNVSNDEQHVSRRRSWQQVSEAIKAEYQAGEGVGKLALAEKYGVSVQQVRRIVGEPEEHTHSTAKLNEEQVRSILLRYEESKGRRGIIKELADAFQVRKSTICDIVARRTWRNIDIEITVPRRRLGSSKSRQSSADAAAS
jgi:plasmid maintenance system antidote protein VapI